MRRQLAFLVLCSGFPVLGSGCATKSFVQTQLGATETKLTQRADTQETKLRETVDRAEASRQAIDEVGTLANDAKTRAATALDADARLSQRLADRNKFRLLETRSIYFDSDKTEIRNQDMNELEDVAKGLKADGNAVLELQGFADRAASRHRTTAAARRRHGQGGAACRREAEHGSLCQGTAGRHSTARPVVVLGRRAGDRPHRSRPAVSCRSVG